MYHLPEFIPDYHPSRGGWMASFVVHLVLKSNLVYGSITSYVWGVVDQHLSHGYVSPLHGVRDWSYFVGLRSTWLVDRGRVARSLG